MILLKIHSNKNEKRHQLIEKDTDIQVVTLTLKW